MQTGQILVVGSLNLDLVMRLPRRPAQGETIRGRDFGMFPGGKGNNQAIAAARAGGSVAMLGRVGVDPFGDLLLQTLAQAGVDGSLVLRDPTAGTGIAMIFIGEDGDNVIGIDPRANGKLSTQDVDMAQAAIASSRLLLLQLEVPLETVAAAAQRARREGTMVVLNPAPAPPDGKLPGDLLRNVDLIIANETEAQLLTGTTLTDRATAIRAAQMLRGLGPRHAIITLGESGALLVEDALEPLFVPAYQVHPIDTTAAGDAFCGALAAAWSRGDSLPDAVRMGCAAGALAATVVGAVPSLPDARQIALLMASGRFRRAFDESPK